MFKTFNKWCDNAQGEILLQEKQEIYNGWFSSNPDEIAKCIYTYEAHGYKDWEFAELEILIAVDYENEHITVKILDGYEQTKVFREIITFSGFSQKQKCRKDFTVRDFDYIAGLIKLVSGIQL